MVELLAPAGSKEALIAAVESGANAIYLAGNMFGARAYASNFDAEGLRWAVNFAHLRNVKIHVTVNTIIDNTELNQIKDFLRFLYEIGADAILVQDLGLAKIAKEIVPDLPLHASTQMTVHNLAGVKALEELGFSRVVLSRELSLEEIKYICKNSNVEIETFMHGALCVCYSGQCLMSSMIGGRSGNRGRCAQPCRLPYSLVDGTGKDLLEGKAGKYLLSPRDLNTIDVVPELIKAGVSSLKIEGRMKRPEYVATVVASYRHVIDNFLNNVNDYSNEEVKKDLAQIFNRDFTTAYLLNMPGQAMISDKRPNNRGLLVGRVVSYDKTSGMVTVSLKNDLCLGDKVDFWVKVGGRVTADITALNNLKGQSIESGKAGESVCFKIGKSVKIGDRVFKIYDAKLMDRAKKVYTNGAPIRRVPIKATVNAAIGEPLTLQLTDDENNTVEVNTDFIGQEAKNRPLTKETIEKQISRLGTTVFSLIDLNINLQDNVMVPVSELNEVRRRATDKLEKKRLEKYRRPELTFDNDIKIREFDRAKKTDNTAILVVSVDDVKKAETVIKAGADAILFGGDNYSHKVLTQKDYAEAQKLALSAEIKFFVNTPRIIPKKEQDDFEKLLKEIDILKPDRIYVHNIGTLYQVKNICSAPVQADYSLISFNSITLDFLREYGVTGATLSPELNMEQIKNIVPHSSLVLECIVGGYIELMVSKYCVTGSFLGGCGEHKCTMPCIGKKYYLNDRKGENFPLVMDQFCNMHVLNCKKLSMLPHLRKLADYGINQLRIEGKHLSSEELYEMVSNYKEVMELSDKNYENQKSVLTDLEGENITRGHYFRGVL